MSDRRDPAFGPAAAALLACGAAALVLGALAVIVSASRSAADALAFMPKVGPLSGEAIISSAAFFAVWKGLGMFWRRADPPMRPVFGATFAMIATGLLLTFPPVYRLF